MKKAIRAALVLYLGCCAISNAHALPQWLQHPSVGAYALAALCFVWIAGAALLIFAPQIGRWFAVLGQVPQMICIAFPGYYYCIFSGIVATLGFSVLPDGDRWTWRPEFEFRGGTFFGLVFGTSLGMGYALVLNFGAILIGLIAFYGLREKKPNQPPEPTSGLAPGRGSS